jgi:hypothetical protein
MYIPLISILLHLFHMIVQNTPSIPTNSNSVFPFTYLNINIRIHMFLKKMILQDFNNFNVHVSCPNELQNFSERIMKL